MNWLNWSAASSSIGLNRISVRPRYLSKQVVGNPALGHDTSRVAPLVRGVVQSKNISSRHRRPRKPAPSAFIPREVTDASVEANGHVVQLTNYESHFGPNSASPKAICCVIIRSFQDALTTSGKSRDGDEAVSAWRRGRILFPKARAGSTARLDRHLLHRTRFRQRHRFPDRTRSRVVALDSESWLHRSQPMVRALRRCESSRLSPLRSGSRFPAPTWKRFAKLR